MVGRAHHAEHFGTARDEGAAGMRHCEIQQTCRKLRTPQHGTDMPQTAHSTHTHTHKEIGIYTRLHECKSTQVGRTPEEENKENKWHGLRSGSNLISPFFTLLWKPATLRSRICASGALEYNGSYGQFFICDGSASAIRTKRVDGRDASPQVSHDHWPSFNYAGDFNPSAGRGTSGANSCCCHSKGNLSLHATPHGLHRPRETLQVHKRPGAQTLSGRPTAKWRPSVNLAPKR